MRLSLYVHMEEEKRIPADYRKFRGEILADYGKQEKKFLQGLQQLKWQPWMILTSEVRGH